MVAHTKPFIEIECHFSAVLMDIFNREVEVVGRLVKEGGRRGALVDGRKSDDGPQLAGCGVGEAEERGREGSLMVALAGENNGESEAKK